MSYNNMYGGYGAYNGYQSSQQIIKVNGEPGARAYQIMPSSSALLLDTTNPIVWLVQTDDAGYKTVTPYKIEPYIQEPEPDIKDIISRIEKLEVYMHESNLAKNESE